jgi:hypothetical protein
MAAVIARDFSGKLNLDSHPSRVPPKDYVSALNITRNGGEGQDDVISNIVGNQQVSYTQHGDPSDNACIGAFADNLRNRVYFCIWNRDDYHSIWYYDRSAGTITRVMESRTDSDDIDVLNFQLKEKINDFDIIHRETDGDLIFFNDGYNRPRGFNVDRIMALVAAGTPIPEYAVCVAKRPPLMPPTPSYYSDSTVTVNNLKGKLFQFIYRWEYQDGYKSTWSPISKTVLPTDGYSLDVDISPTQNNVINLRLVAGGVGYQKIQIGMRLSLGTTYSDFYLVDTIDRDDYSLNPNSTYTYRFLNDGAYETIPVNESDQLFDYVPDLANTQTMPNGNTLMYMGITEGYDPIAREDVNVQVVANLVDTSPNSEPTTPPTLTYSIENTGASHTQRILRVILGGGVSAGCLYHVEFITSDGTTADVEYTADSGDTIDTVRGELVTLLTNALPVNYSVATENSTTIKIETFTPSDAAPQFYFYINIYAEAPSVTQGSAPTWNYSSGFRLGLVYRDQYGKTNGVVSFVSDATNPNDFYVQTPNFVINGSNSNAPQVPRIQATISHLPPSWATHFQWVRTANLTKSYSMYYVTCQVDAEDGYLYLCIGNLDKFKEDTTGFVPSYSYLAGDRVKVICTVDTSDTPAYTESYHNADYEIVGVFDRPIPGAGTDVVGRFLKVRQPTGTTYNAFQLIEIYRPALRANNAGQVFYEFGEVYPIYTLNGVAYHTGGTQNQTSTLPARFTFNEGDVFYKFRKFYKDTLTATSQFELGVMDANYSDFWASAVNSNGRAFIIEANAKRVYNPVLWRHGQPFQQGINVNGLNRFYEADRDEVNRQFGDVKRIKCRDNAVIVFQKFKIGAIPVDQQITYNVDQTANVILSSRLLNKIQYYKGEWGIGDNPESLGWNTRCFYGADNSKGVWWRLSQDGLEDITRHGMSSFGKTEVKARNATYKIYGLCDTDNNLYIARLENAPGRSNKVIVWNEDRNGWESELSYQFEMGVCLNGLVVTFSSGRLYTHDSPTYNNFYGTQYDSYVTAMFNDDAVIKKSFEHITYVGTEGFDAPEIHTSNFSYGSTRQKTSIKAGAFVDKENEWHAAIPKDENSGTSAVQGKIDGKMVMKGQWLKVKFRFQSASNFLFLFAVILGYAASNKQPNKS